MVWEPFLLAIGFGLAVSAAIYFAILWPQVEPLDDAEARALGIDTPALGPTGGAAAAGDAAVAPGDERAGGAADADDDAAAGAPPRKP